MNIFHVIISRYAIWRPSRRSRNSPSLGRISDACSTRRAKSGSPFTTLRRYGTTFVLISFFIYKKYDSYAIIISIIFSRKYDFYFMKQRVTKLLLYCTLLKCLENFPEAFICFSGCPTRPQFPRRLHQSGKCAQRGEDFRPVRIFHFWEKWIDFKNVASCSVISLVIGHWADF